MPMDLIHGELVLLQQLPLNLSDRDEAVRISRRRYLLRSPEITA